MKCDLLLNVFNILHNFQKALKTIKRPADLRTLHIIL